MYKFFKDKSEIFECKINIEGASLTKAKPRLILENEEFSLIFEGKIDSTGKCSIPVKKLKVLSENLQGNLKLEVIVDDDVYFIPYQDKFMVSVDKKVTVEVLSKEETSKEKKVIVEVIQKPNILAESLAKIMRLHQISVFNLNKSPKFPKLLKEFIEKNQIPPEQINELKENLMVVLIKDLG